VTSLSCVIDGYAVRACLAFRGQYAGARLMTATTDCISFWKSGCQHSHSPVILHRKRLFISSMGQSVVALRPWVTAVRIKSSQDAAVRPCLWWTLEKRLAIHGRCPPFRTHAVARRERCLVQEAMQRERR
jgi:hypothetical protein